MLANYTDEIQALTQRLEDNPESMLFARLADRYLKMKEIDRAKELCLKGLKNHPDYATAHFVLAKIHYTQKQFDEAEKRLKKVFLLEPNFLAAHKMYADLMIEIGWQKSSEMSLRRILEFDPLDKNIRQQIEKLAAGEPVEEEKIEDVFQEPEGEEAATEASLTQELESETLGVEGFEDEGEILPDLEEKADLEFIDQDFEKEEARFSEILDDIFSPSLEEEKKLEEEARSTLERFAKEDAGEISDVEEETLEAEKETLETAEKEVGEEQKVEPEPVTEKPVEEEKSEEERLAAEKEEEIDEKLKKEMQAKKEEEEQEFPPIDFSFLEDEHPEEAAKEEDLAQPDFEPISFDEDQEEEEFSQFLSELDELESTDKDLMETDLDILEEEESSVAGQEEKAPPEPTAAAEKEPEIETEAQASSEAPAAEATPEPTFEQAKHEMPESAPEPKTSEEPKRKFVTPTLGEIYAAQGQYAKAITVFEHLLQEEPNNEKYKSKLEYLRKKLEESKE